MVCHFFCSAATIYERWIWTRPPPAPLFFFLSVAVRLFHWGLNNRQHNVWMAHHFFCSMATIDDATVYNHHATASFFFNTGDSLTHTHAFSNNEVEYRPLPLGEGEGGLTESGSTLVHQRSTSFSLNGTIRTYLVPRSSEKLVATHASWLVLVTRLFLMN